MKIIILKKFTKWCHTNIMNYIDIYESMRAVKMGWNPRVNLAHHGFRLGWTWTEFFLQISIRVDF